MTGLEPTPYTGVENLEVMREAVNYNRYLQSLVERHAAGAKRVIDFGAGSGTFAIPCAAAGFALTAVEPDEQLRALLAAAGVDAVADVAALANEAFHYAYTLNVLEHIEDDVEALRVLRAKLVLRGSLEAAGFGSSSCATRTRSGSPRRCCSRPSTTGAATSIAACSASMTGWLSPSAARSTR